MGRGFVNAKGRQGNQGSVVRPSGQLRAAKAVDSLVLGRETRGQHIRKHWERVQKLVSLTIQFYLRQPTSYDWFTDMVELLFPAWTDGSRVSTGPWDEERYSTWSLAGRMPPDAQGSGVLTEKVIVGGMKAHQQCACECLRVQSAGVHRESACLEQISKLIT